MPVTSAQAACNVTSGSVAVPDHGSTVNCSGSSTVVIGDSTTSATVILEDDAEINGFINLDSTTVEIGNGATINTGYYVSIRSHSSADTNVTLGDDVTINTQDKAIKTGGDLIVDGGDNVSITSYSNVIDSNGDLTITLGNNADLTSSYGHAIYSKYSSNITAGDNFTLSANGIGINNYSGDMTVTLGNNANIYSYNNFLQAFHGNVNFTSGGNLVLNTQNTAFNIDHGTINIGANSTIHAGSIYGYGIFADDAIVTLGANTTLTAGYIAIRGAHELNMATGSSVTSYQNTGVQARDSAGASDLFDIAGTIQGANGTSVNMMRGDDNLILRTGANLIGDAYGGLGADTLTLYGTNSEETDFHEFESLVMEGTSWTLTGTSAFDDITINNGLLKNNGLLTGDLLINSNGTFGGTGTITGNVINNGVLAPGDTIGTTTITGNYTQNSGGELSVGVGTSATDLLDISGTAALDGTLRLTELGTISAASTFTILNADGGITGEFSSILNNFTFLNPNIDYDTNSVTLSFTAAQLNDPDKAKNHSEQTVAGGLDDLFNDDAGALPDVQTLLNGLDDEQTSDLLSSQSGIIKIASVAAIAQTVNLNTQVAMNRVGMNVAGRNNNGIQLASIEPAASLFSADGSYIRPAALWMQATGGRGRVESDSSARGTKYHSYGTVAGFDIYDSGTTYGVFGSYSHSIAGFSDSALSDKGKTDVYQLGGYGGFSKGSWDFAGSLSAAYLDFDTTRPTGLGTASADFNGGAVFGQLDATYNINLKDNIVISPVASIETSYVAHEGYTEKGAGGLNASFKSSDTSSLATVAGVRISRTVVAEENKITPSLQLGWAHEFLDQSSNANVSFVNAPSVSYNTEGPEKQRDSLRVAFDVDMASTDYNEKGLSGYFGYKGDFSGSSNDHSATIGIRYRW